MQRITRNDFLWRYRAGIDLDSPQLKKKLEGRADLKMGLDKCDANKNGKLVGGRELRCAFGYVDKMEQEKPHWLVKPQGDAKVLLEAIEAGAKKRPDFGAAILRAAQQIMTKQGAAHALAGTPTCPNPVIAGNSRPGRSPLRWLKGWFKCNQFVGDALYKAGAQMPLHRPGKGIQYVGATSLHTFTKHFDQITDLKNVRPGDVIQLDFVPGPAHCAIVSRFDAKTKTMYAIGARADGARERSDWTGWLRDMKYDAKNKCWVGHTKRRRTKKSVELRLRFLRPKMPAKKAKAARS